MSLRGDGRLLFCVDCRLSLASLSAFSFPNIPEWPGIQRSLIVV